jgi:hypothetical protein
MGEYPLASESWDARSHELYVPVLHVHIMQCIEEIADWLRINVLWTYLLLAVLWIKTENWFEVKNKRLQINLSVKRRDVWSRKNLFILNPDVFLLYALGCYVIKDD